MNDLKFYVRKLIQYINKKNKQDIGIEDIVLATGITTYYRIKAIALYLEDKGVLTKTGRRWIVGNIKDEEEADNQ